MRKSLGLRLAWACIKPMAKYKRVSRLCELRRCARSFFDFFSFSRREVRYFVLSSLDIGEYKCFNGDIYRNLRKLSLLFCC